MDGVQRATVPTIRYVGPGGESMEVIHLSQYARVSVQRGEFVDVTDLSQYGRVPIQSVGSASDSVVVISISWIQPGIDTESTIQTETEGVLQRVIEESIETYENRPTPACPVCVEMLLQKVEIGNIPEGLCCICMDDLLAEMEVCAITRCSHFFHKACIMKWLEESNVCPLCRLTFPEKLN